MSEYWKSTPKYWCKFCKIYVRDTKFERQQHDATGKHQSNIQRSLRDIHRNQEREEREKQRAKDEVARLNGVVSGAAASKVSTDAPLKKRAAAVPHATAQATPEERKRQMAQLAEMGVAIPEEFRREMAMAGDWQTLSVNAVGSNVKQEDEDIKLEMKAFGVRKRKLDGQDGDDTLEQPVRKVWGSSFKAYPGKDSAGDDEDLESLLKPRTPTTGVAAEETADPKIKREESMDGAKPMLPADLQPPASEDAKGNTDDPPGVGVVFKKRKGKKTLAT